MGTLAGDTDTGTRSHEEAPAVRARGRGSVRNTRPRSDAYSGWGRVFRTARAHLPDGSQQGH